MTLIDKLDKLLAEKGWTQGAFERHCVLAENRISRWKGGMGEPTATQALRMARALNVPVEFLLDDQIDDVAKVGGELRTDERAVVGLYRILGIGVEEALARLHTPLASRPSSGQSRPRKPG